MKVETGNCLLPLFACFINKNRVYFMLYIFRKSERKQIIDYIRLLRTEMKVETGNCLLPLFACFINKNRVYFMLYIFRKRSEFIWIRATSYN